MGIFEIDAMRDAREQEIKSLLKRRDWLAAEMNRCKEAGPLMQSLRKEWTYVKKQLQMI
jgi:hypothetical protein